MKKLLVFSFLCLLGQFVFAQDLVRRTNGEILFTKIESIDSEKISYSVGPRQVSISVDSIAFIEYLEGGVEYFNRNSIQKIDPKEIDGLAHRHGNKVYVPFSSETVAQRSGSLKLKELITNSGLWEVVACEEEAHFIMKFVYSEEGKDHGTIVILDRLGNLLYESPKVKNSDFVPSHKGQEIAESLFRKYIKNLVIQ